MELTIHIDGGSRGNPGPAGAGVVIVQADGTALFEAGFFLGRMTNNMAEYHGLIRALEAAEAWPDAALSIVSDSQLMVRQITGQYRVKNAKLAPLFEEVRKRLLGRESWRIRHVLREENTRADALANSAMDASADVIEVDDRDPTPPVGRGGNGATATRRKTRKTKSVPRPGRCIEVRCTRPPTDGACPAPCKPDDAFYFETVAPRDLCLDAVAAMLNTVLALRDATLEADQQPPAMTVRCAKPDCGAAFELMIDSSTSGS
ncbi:MAG: reverse transcriptase-like protein [Phycisphaerae bacterium]